MCYIRTPVLLCFAGGKKFAGMSIVSTFFRKVWHLILSFLKLLRRAVCCRKRRHDADMLLPMTMNELHFASSETIRCSSSPDTEFQNWEVWNENEQQSTSIGVGTGCEQRRLSNGTIPGLRSMSKDSYEENEDFFADMVPQFKKPKKLIVHSPDNNPGSVNTSYPSRLSMDSRVPPMQGAELGILDDNPPTSWEDGETLEELWDPDSLIREKRMAEREQRLAEHQRRKLEKENRRLSKQDISLASKLS